MIAERAGGALVIVEDDADRARAASADGFAVASGNASDPYILGEAGIGAARKLVIAIPEGFEAGAIAEHARRLNPDLEILARAHSDEEVVYLERHKVDHVVLGEREIANRLLQYLLAKKPAVSSH